MEPEETSVKPEIASKVVLFPDPLAPRRTMIWPLSAVSDNLLTAKTVSFALTPGNQEKVRDQNPGRYSLENATRSMAFDEPSLVRFSLRALDAVPYSFRSSRAPSRGNATICMMNKIQRTYPGSCQGEFGPP